MYLGRKIRLLEVVVGILQAHRQLVLRIAKRLLPLLVRLGLREEQAVHFGDVLLPIPNQCRMVINYCNILTSETILPQNRKKILVAAVSYRLQLVIVPQLPENILDVTVAHAAAG